MQRQEDIASLSLADLGLFYERLVAMYWHQMKAFVLRHIDNPQDAEDIVQEAFVRAYYALEGYPIEQIRTLKVRPWLYKITWNAYCRYTGRSKLPPSGLLNPLDDALEYEGMWHEQPEVAFEQTERREELESLVSGLPSRYRDVVSLYYFEELSHQEIADMLNQRPGTIRVALHRGIQLLRKMLATQTRKGEYSDGYR